MNVGLPLYHQYHLGVVGLPLYHQYHLGVE